MAEYARTPYLFTSLNDAEGGKEFEKTLEEYRGDAATEYERALAAVNLIQTQLDEAGFQVLSQDRLEDFNAVVEAVEQGTALPALNATETTRLLELRERKNRQHETLNAAEEAELQELTLRELHSEYGELILARAESIKHTARMIRVHKASEIIGAEIMRRRLVAEEKQKQFDQILGQKFGTAPNETIEDARNAVYLRMAGMVEGGGSFFNEFRGWYFGQNQWASDAYSTYHGSILNTAAGMGQAMVLKFWPTQIIETAVGMAMTNSIPLLDQQAIGLWMAAGNTVAEYASFKGVYFSALALLGVMDQMKLKHQVTVQAYTPVIAVSCIVGGFVPFINPVCEAAKNEARRKITMAKMQWQYATLAALITYSNSRDTASGASAQAVMGPQREAEDAWAALYYFTRIKDQQTLKERLIEYGRQRQDDDSTEALYQLSEEDLVYLFEMVNGNLESLRADGSNNNPDAAVRSEALDITGIKETVEYKDAFGRHYDPESLVDGQPGPLVGGAYLAGDGSQYTRIKFFRHDGSTYYRYARLIPKGTTPAEQYAYDMSKVLDAAVAHGQAIRDQRLAAYMQAGNEIAQLTGDSKLILEDRDQTFEELFNAAAGHREGGREFTGYRMTYQDYLANSSQVVLGELEQRITVQQKDWELKELEMLDKIASWEGRVNTILERGRKNWSGAEDRFLAEWRKWRKDFDEKEEEAREAWDVKIADHFKAKEAWETGIRQNASEETIERVLSEAVLALNAQMQNFGKQHGVALPAIDLISTVNLAVEKMKRDMPSAAERLTEINKDIVNFKTHFSLSEMVGADLLSGALSVAGDFQAEMNAHAKRMKVLSNVQAFEEYRKMQVEFKKSIQVQNESVDQSTAASAMAAGYMRQGSRFIKQAHGTASFGAVDAYSYFDADHHLDQALRESGFADKSGEDLVRFLEHASDVETETYFYVQKLALQAAFEKILGRGGDKGSFARWVGDPPPDMASQAVTKAAGSAFSANMFERGLAIDMATAGSGELGSGSTRPGGAPAGFYVQLKWMDGWVQQEQNRHIADRQAGMNAPVWDTITDLLDPLIGMGYYQQMGKLENGPSTTQVAQASLMNLTSSLMKIGGAVMVVAGVATGWTGLGIGLAAGGAALIYAGNAIQADMKTGETSFKLTEAGAINATVSVGLSAAGAYFAGGTATLAEEAGKKAFEEALKTGATQAAAETAKAKAYEEVVKAAVLPTAVKMGGLGVATGAASAGLQYNSQQQLVGYKLGGKGTDAAFATAAMGGVASGALAYLGGSAFGANSSQFAQVYGNATMGFLGSKVGSDLASYATRQIYGAEYSSYDMLGQTGDWSGLVGLAGAWAQAANQQNQQQRARDTMNGAAYVQARREQGGYTPTEADITRATDEATAIALSQGLGKGKWNDVNNGIRSLVNQGMDPASAAAAVLQGMGVDLRNVNPSAVQASYNLMHKEQQQALATAAWNKLTPEQQAAVFAGDPYNMTDGRTGLPAIGGLGAAVPSGGWISNKLGEWKDYFVNTWENPGTTARAALGRVLQLALDVPLGGLAAGLNAIGLPTPGNKINEWLRPAEGYGAGYFDAAQARLAEGEMVGGFLTGAGGLVRGAVSGIRGLLRGVVTKNGAGYADDVLRGASDLGHGYAREILPGGTGRAFAGHGEFRFGAGDAIVPDGSTLTMWSKPGVKLSDRVGQLIENGQYDDLMQLAMKDRRVMQQIEGAASYLPGSRVPNYTLRTPDNLTIFQRSLTVDSSTQLSQLLRPGMGHVEWAACTVFR